MKLGDVLLGEISESQRSKWQDMIESTYFTHSGCKERKTINRLTKDNIAPQQQCIVITDQVTNQLLLNGKGTRTMSHKKKKIKKRCNRLDTDTTIPHSESIRYI